MSIKKDDRVQILVGDEAGGWGIVRLVRNGEYHVGLYGAASADRVYDESEIRKIREPYTAPNPAGPTSDGAVFGHQCQSDVSDD